MPREFATGVRFAVVSTLPAAASSAGVVLEQGGKLWFSDGAAWVDLGADGSATWGAITGAISAQADVANFVAVPKVRIAVIGDSLATQNMLMADSWPARLETLLRQSGVDVEVYNCSQSANTFFRAVTNTDYGTLTPVQQAIAFDPHIVIVSLGLNDVVSVVDGRSLAQAQADATTLFSTLSSALPSASILYAGERAYDATNFPAPGTTLKNKGTIGTYFQLRTTGILTGLYCSEVLEDSVSATTQSRFADWIALNSHVSGLATVDGTCAIDYFRIHRSGCAVEDLLHITGPGNQLAAGYVIAALRNAPFSSIVPRIRSNTSVPRNDPDSFFTELFTQSGDGWTWDGGSSADSVMLSLYGAMRPDTWYLPRDIKFNFTNAAGLALNVFPDNAPDFVRITTGLRPGEAIEVSVNGGGWAGPQTVGDTGNHIGTSNGRGLARNVGYGSHSFRYRVANMAFGPVTFTVSDDTYDVVSAPSTRNLTLLDLDRVLTVAAGSTLTIPPQASVAWRGQSEIRIIKVAGTGSVIIAPGSGVTLHVSDGGLPRVSSDYEIAVIKRIAADEWVLTKIGGSDPRVIPLNTQNAAYTFALTDRGRAVVKNNTTAYTWTIPLESSVAFPDGSAITVINDSGTGAVTISPTGGVTLIAGATTGSFTLAVNESRTLHKVGTNRWRVL